MNKIDLLYLAHSIGKYCIGMEGNVSARTLDGGLLIKSSGANLNNLRDNEVSKYSKDGILESDKRGSIETEFHKVIYDNLPDVDFIAHTHPINTLKLLCGNPKLLNEFATLRMYPEQVIFNGANAVTIGYHKPGKPLAKAIEDEILHYYYNQKAFPNLILLMNHGIIALGKTVNECVAITETCEKSAEIFLGAFPTGKIRFLSEQSVQDLLDDENEKYRISLCK